MGGFDAENEGDGIHGVGLAGAIGSDDGGEVAVAESQDMVALVGLEVEKLERVEFAHLVAKVVVVHDEVRWQS